MDIQIASALVDELVQRGLDRDAATELFDVLSDIKVSTNTEEKIYEYLFTSGLSETETADWGTYYGSYDSEDDTRQ